jgi:hypothetical protein
MEENQQSTCPNGNGYSQADRQAGPAANDGDCVAIEAVVAVEKRYVHTCSFIFGMNLYIREIYSRA